MPNDEGIVWNTSDGEVAMTLCKTSILTFAFLMAATIHSADAQWAIPMATPSAPVGEVEPSAITADKPDLGTVKQIKGMALVHIAHNPAGSQYWLVRIDYSVEGAGLVNVLRIPNTFLASTECPYIFDGIVSRPQYGLTHVSANVSTAYPDGTQVFVPTANFTADCS
jgi:hypothetical protein